MKKRPLYTIAITLLLVLVIVVAVSAQERDEGVAAKIDMEPPEAVREWQEEPGLLITGLVAGGPAATAGLRRGDIILAVDGQEVGTPADLQGLIQAMGAGTRITLDVLRCEQMEQIVIVLGEMDNTGRGYLGVSLIPPITQEPPLAHSFAKGVELRGQGALIVKVETDTPAAAAGLQEGDRVLAVNGAEITAANPLAELVRAQGIGDEVTLTVMRGNLELTLDAILVEHPVEAGVAYLGVRVAPTLVGRETLESLPWYANGSRVVSVDPGSPAEAAGIEPGDLVVAVDDDAVGDSQALIGLIRSYESGDTVTLTVERDGDELELAATLGSTTDNTGESAYLGVRLAQAMRWQGNLRQFPHGMPATPGEGKSEWFPVDSEGWPSESEPFEFLLPENQRPPARDGAEA
jgi:S1-C subfamily serine protease